MLCLLTSCCACLLLVVCSVVISRARCWQYFVTNNLSSLNLVHRRKIHRRSFCHGYSQFSILNLKKCENSLRRYSVQQIFSLLLHLQFIDWIVISPEKVILILGHCFVILQYNITDYFWYLKECLRGRVAVGEMVLSDLGWGHFIAHQLGEKRTQISSIGLQLTNPIPTCSNPRNQRLSI